MNKKEIQLLLEIIKKNSLNIMQLTFFRKSYELFTKLKNHENLDNFCENEAFGFLFSTEHDSIQNRESYTRLLKAYIINNK